MKLRTYHRAMQTVAVASLMVAMVFVLALFSPAPVAAQSNPGLVGLDRINLDNQQVDNPFAVELDPQTGLFHVGDTTSGKITLFDSNGRPDFTNGQNYGSPQVPGYLNNQNPGTDVALTYPSDIAFMDAWIYVAYFNDGAIVRYNRADLTFDTAYIPAAQPVGIDAADGQVYITLRAANQIEVLDADLSPIRTIDTDIHCPNDVAVIGNWVYSATIANNNLCPNTVDRGIFRYDKTTGAFDSSFFVELTTYAISATPQGQLFATAGTGMAVIDPTIGQVTTEIDLGIPVTGITTHSSGNTAWAVQRSFTASPALFGATVERCAETEPRSAALDGSLLRLFAAGADGAAPDSQSNNTVCSTHGRCTEIGEKPVTIKNGYLTQRECNALEDLYWSTNGPEWTNNTGWSDMHEAASAVAPCSWHGLACGTSGLGTIVLEENGLSGSLPETLGDLSLLSTLVLSDNEIGGPLPESMSRLGFLSQLDMTNNELTGPLPAWFGDLPGLTRAFLQDNQLSGPIPASIGNLNNLQTLNLTNNQLSGPIPTSIDNLNNLRGLVLSSNQLSGPIPTSIGNLNNLQNLNLSNNQLSGPIPASIGNLNNLQNLYLDENRLSGPIPASAGNLDNLKALNLAGNDLTAIPAELQNLDSLEVLRVSGTNCLVPETEAVLQFYEGVAVNDASFNRVVCQPRDDSFTFTPPHPAVFDVQSNDQLPASATTSITVTSQPNDATAEFIDGAVRYTPQIASFRQTEFTYEVCSTLGCEEATVRIDVQPPTCRNTRGELKTAHLWGTNGDDDITLTEPGDYVIVTFGGDDTVTRADDDSSTLVCTGDGDDTISLVGFSVVRAGGGNDTVTTGARRDYIYGDDGNDTIDAGLAVDRVWGGAGDDQITGGGGSDRIYGGTGADTVRAGSGADRVWGGPGNDVLLGQGGQDRMWGEAGNDTMQGNWQSDRLWGGPGDDVLRGAQGKDRLYGQGGNDRLFGGDNTDYLHGGPGTDFGNGQRGKDNPVVVDVSGCQSLETKVSC